MPKKSFPVGALLESVTDQMLEGFQVISPDFRYLYVNKTVSKQGKKPKKDLLGKTMMECYPGIEKTILFEQIKKCLREKVSVSMDNEFTFPDKTRGWFQLYMNPCEEGAVIFSVDITKRKTLEKELEEKITEINKIMEIVVDREVRMRELKGKISELEQMVKKLDRSRT